MDKRLEGKRVLITQAGGYMGPPTVELFREHGAEVVADTSDLVTGREDALFALFLASDKSDFFVGQAIPFSGGVGAVVDRATLNSGPLPGAIGGISWGG